MNIHVDTIHAGYIDICYIEEVKRYTIVMGAHERVIDIQTIGLGNQLLIEAVHDTAQTTCNVKCECSYNTLVTIDTSSIEDINTTGQERHKDLIYLELHEFETIESYLDPLYEIMQEEKSL